MKFYQWILVIFLMLLVGGSGHPENSWIVFIAALAFHFWRRGY